MEIEIPDHIYEHAIEGSEDSRDESEAIYAIKNGKQLKIGHWIERRNRATGRYESVCSVCGAEESSIYNLYCGNCGAEMQFT